MIWVMFLLWTLMLMSFSFHSVDMMLCIELSYHNLWYLTNIFHWWVYFSIFISVTKLMLISCLIKRIWSNRSIGKGCVTKLLFHKFFIVLSLCSFSLSIKWVPIIFVLKSKNLWSYAFFFIISEVSEQIMRSVICLIGLFYYDRMLLHFS